MNLLKNPIKLKTSCLIALTLTIWACGNKQNNKSVYLDAIILKKESVFLPQIEWSSTEIQFQNYESGNINPSVIFSIIVKNASDKTFILPVSKSSKGLFGTTFCLNYMGDTINLKSLNESEIQILPFSSDSFDLTIDYLPYSSVNDFVFAITRISENYKMLFSKENALIGNDSFYVFDQFISKGNKYQTRIIRNRIFSKD